MKKIIGIVFIALLLLLGFFGYREYRKLQNVYSEINSISNKVETIDDSTYKHYAAVSNKIDISNKEVKEALDKQGAKIVSLNKTTLELKKQVSDSKASGTRDTIVANGDTIEYNKVTFNDTLAHGLFNIYGNTMYNIKEPKNSLAHLELEQILPLKINTAISKSKAGLFSTYLWTNHPDMKITADSTIVNIPKEGVIKKNWKYAIIAGFVAYLLLK